MSESTSPDVGTRRGSHRSRPSRFVGSAVAVVLVLGIAVGASAQETSGQRERKRLERLARCSAAIGCTPFSYGVSLIWAEGWRPGPYELTISIDGTTRNCTVTAPDAVCGDPTTALERHRQAKQCDLGPFGYVALIDRVRIPADWPPAPMVLTPAESDQFDEKLYQLPGCALPGRHASLAVLDFRTRLNSVKVSVSTGGRVVGLGDYRPIYEMWKPLGSDCDFACPRAKGDTLVINP